MKFATHIRRIGAGKHRPNFFSILAAAIIVISSSLVSNGSPKHSKAKSAGSYDKPVKKIVLHVGPYPQLPDEPHGPQIRSTISCFYFPDLLIKQYYQNGDCGGGVSFLRSREKLPACKLSHEPGEQFMGVVGGPDEGSDYFDGVKGNLVFVDFCEDEQGAVPFAVYDSTTGKKLFTDSTTSSRLQVFSTKAGVLIKYVRAINAGCDLYAKGKACWEGTRAKFGLKGDHKPVCRGYPGVYKEFNVDEDDSMLGYPVQVNLSPHPVIKPVAGPPKCWSTY